MYIKNILIGEQMLHAWKLGALETIGEEMFLKLLNGFILDFFEVLVSPLAR